MGLRQAGTLLALGVATGLVLALVASDFARSFLFGLEPGDLEPMAIACVSLAAPTIIAILVPAWRAAMLEPLAALRDE
jgi:ABC-type lipoprotein release transport system permease subunit